MTLSRDSVTSTVRALSHIIGNGLLFFDWIENADQRFFNHRILPSTYLQYFSAIPHTVSILEYSGHSSSMKNQPFLKRMGFAWQGIATAFRMESSFRLQCMASLAVLGILLWSKPTMIWWALLLLNCGMVLAAELFNTALEHLIDHLHPTLHPSIKVAKDCAAGSVLILSCGATCIFVAFLIENVFN